MTRDSHDGKDLIEILEDYPREELFEISAAELTPIALGVLALRERKQTRLFLRRDRLRPVHVVPGVPAEGPVHHQGPAAGPGASCAARCTGVSVDYSAMVGDSALARLHVVIRGEQGRPVPQVDAAALEPSWPPRSGPGTRTSPPRRLPRARRGAGRGAAGPVRRRPSPGRTRPTFPRPTR